MRVQLQIDLNLPSSSDWLNTKLAALQQSVNEVNALADFLDLDANKGESIDLIVAGFPGQHGEFVHVLGGTYTPVPENE